MHADCTLPLGNRQAAKDWEGALKGLIERTDMISSQHNPGGAYRLHGPAHVPAQPADERAAVVAIAPEQLDPGKALLEWLEHPPGSLLIRAVGAGHLDGQQMALRFNEHVSFATPRFFFRDRSLSQGHEPHWF